MKHTDSAFTLHPSPFTLKAIGLGAFLLIAPFAEAGDTYCSQLKALGLTGKYAAVTSTLGSSGSETREGVILTIEPGALILNPNPDPDSNQPIYEDGKIVEPFKTRVYLNCDHIASVTTDPLPLSR